MKFGMFGGISAIGGDISGYQNSYETYIDAVIEAEALGFHGNFVVEHHFTGMGQDRKSVV